MTTQMIIRLDSKKREMLNRLSHVEGKTTSEVVRTLIDDFLVTHDVAGHIDDLWSRIGNKMTKKGHSSADVSRFIQESRKKTKV